jgi:hypothetical protein
MKGVSVNRASDMPRIRVQALPVGKLTWAGRLEFALFIDGFPPPAYRTLLY